MAKNDTPASVRFRVKITAAAQTKADADMALAAIYKDAENAGLHRQALKLAVKLFRQDSAKTAAFFEAFDQYVVDFGLKAQTTLPFAEQHLAERNGEQPQEPEQVSLGEAMAKAIEADGGESKPKATSEKAPPAVGPTRQNEARAAANRAAIATSARLRDQQTQPGANLRVAAEGGKRVPVRGRRGGGDLPPAA